MRWGTTPPEVDAMAAGVSVLVSLQSCICRFLGHRGKAQRTCEIDCTRFRGNPVVCKSNFLITGKSSAFVAQSCGED